MKRVDSLVVGMALASLMGCTAEPASTDGFARKVDGKADASAQAIFLNMEFDAELVTDWSYDDRQTIQDQLLYTIGHLNGDNAVGRLDQLTITDLQRSSEDDGRTRISYHAVLPVAWGNKNDYPETYTFTLPIDVSYSGQERFTETYQDSCVERGAHDVDSGSMWYYFRPDNYDCRPADSDVIHTDATVTVSDTNTTGKYPEYDKVWEDGELRVVAVFGKYEDGATTADDSGIAGYNLFLRSVEDELSSAELVTTPADVPGNPGVEAPEVRFEATLEDGRKVTVDALLVDNVRTAGADFDQRYGELTPSADLIVYNGHAGLGANIRALAQKGTWVPGQYKMVFLNGCDTYAYIDSAITEAHAAINEDDPTGTKYVDMITNAMPSFFMSMPGASMALIRGLLDYDAPRTFEQIFTDVDSSQVVLVHGEEDNTFVPGGGGGDPVASWEGLDESGTVRRTATVEEHRFETPVLPPGRYEFAISGSGDADLYVRVGEAPTAELYDCRPFLTGSQERCVVDLSTATRVYAMVRAWAAESSYELTAGPQ